MVNGSTLTQSNSVKLSMPGARTSLSLYAVVVLPPLCFTASSANSLAFPGECIEGSTWMADLHCMGQPGDESSKPGSVHMDSSTLHLSLQQRREEGSSFMAAALKKDVKVLCMPLDEAARSVH